MGTILIVDDDNELRELITLYLKPLKHEIHHAVNGVEALHQAQAHKPDLILLDLMMPMASGDLVLGFIRSTPLLQDTPVIVVSAHPKIADLADHYQADNYVRKPFTVGELRDVVKVTLAKYYPDEY